MRAPADDKLYAPRCVRCGHFGQMFELVMPLRDSDAFSWSHFGTLTLAPRSRPAENGETASIIRAVAAIDTCLRCARVLCERPCLWIEDR